MAHTFSPERATTAYEADEYLPELPNESFRIMWHPEKWEEIAGEWLPVITWWRLKPGANGVKSNTLTGHLQATTIMEHVRGFVVLDPTRTPVIHLDENGKQVETLGYVDKYKARRGRYVGTFHASPWETPEIVGRGARARVTWPFDQDTFDVWRRAMVKSKMIERPHKATLDAVIDVQRRRAERRLTEAHDGAPHIQRIVNEQLARADRMQAAADIITADEVKPKRRKKAVRTTTEATP